MYGIELRGLGFWYISSNPYPCISELRSTYCLWSVAKGWTSRSERLWFDRTFSPFSFSIPGTISLLYFSFKVGSERKMVVWSHSGRINLMCHKVGKAGIWFSLQGRCLKKSESFEIGGGILIYQREVHLNQLPWEVVPNTDWKKQDLMWLNSRALIQEIKHKPSLSRRPGTGAGKKKSLRSQEHSFFLYLLSSTEPAGTSNPK